MDVSDPAAAEHRGPAAKPPRNAATPRPSAIARTFAVATDRVARFIPGGRATRLVQRGDDDTSAYHQAVRRAFLAAESIEPARAQHRPATGAEVASADPVESTPLEASLGPTANAVAQAVASPPAAPSTAALVGDSAGARSPAPLGATDLIQAPASVKAATDDFFGGLVRRVERRP